MKELITSKWVTVKKYCEMSGDTTKAVYIRRSKGVWAEGVHAKKIPGMGVMINLEEINKWIESSQLESQ
jgi:hypothetical protein